MLEKRLSFRMSFRSLFAVGAACYCCCEPITWAGETAAVDQLPSCTKLYLDFGYSLPDNSFFFPFL